MGGSSGYYFRVREPEDPLWGDIRRHPTRLFLGGSLSSVACLRFTGVVLI